MKAYLARLGTLLPGELVSAFGRRFRRGPITAVDAVAEFVQTRAAFIAQTSLFGYLKERMGTSYPRYFEDEAFAASIRLAQLRIYRACAADLAIFAAAILEREAGLGGKDAARLAEHCFAYALANSGADMGEVGRGAREAFEDRVRKTNWKQAAIGENAFLESPEELIAAAPVIDSFKHMDREIVTNSIRFRWRDVREQFRKRADLDAIRADFSSHLLD